MLKFYNQDSVNLGFFSAKSKNCSNLRKDFIVFRKITIVKCEKIWLIDNIKYWC